MQLTSDLVALRASQCESAEGVEIGQMLRELARLLRAEEEEAKRDVINDPMPGDCIYIMSNPLVFIEDPEETGADALSGGCTCCDFWKDAATHEGAVVVPRREVAK